MSWLERESGSMFQCTERRLKFQVEGHREQQDIILTVTKEDVKNQYNRLKIVKILGQKIINLELTKYGGHKASHYSYLHGH